MPKGKLSLRGGEKKKLGLKDLEEGMLGAGTENSHV